MDKLLNTIKKLAMLSIILFVLGVAFQVPLFNVIGSIIVLLSIMAYIVVIFNNRYQ